jgi:hypothetical protein
MCCYDAVLAQGNPKRSYGVLKNFGIVPDEYPYLERLQARLCGFFNS